MEGFSIYIVSSAPDVINKTVVLKKVHSISNIDYPFS